VGGAILSSPMKKVSKQIPHECFKASADYSGSELSICLLIFFNLIALLHR
jgi:hypothetical protein